MNPLYLFAIIPAGTIATIYLIRKLRELQWGWVRNNYSLEGKIYIVTGANTGLGYETTKILAERNATVIMACRNSERANDAIAKIRQHTAKGKLIYLELDLSSFDSIKQFSQQIKTEYSKFNVLINNAGLAVQNTQMITKEGYELTFGTNHLGHFLLTELLMENIKTNNSRVVVVSSMLHARGKIEFETLGKCLPPSSIVGRRRTNTNYNDSKLANFYFAIELYKQGIDCHVLCPGLCHTDFFRDYNPKWYHYILFAPVVWLMLRSAEQGAQNIIYSATDNENTELKNPATGYLVRNCTLSKSKYKFNDEISERLWLESRRMCDSALN